MCGGGSRRRVFSIPTMASIVVPARSRVIRPSRHGHAGTHGVSAGLPNSWNLSTRFPMRIWRSMAAVRRFSRLFGRPRKLAADYYIESTPSDGVPYWDTGAPGLDKLPGWADRAADPFNAYEPVDSGAVAIAGSGAASSWQASEERPILAGRADRVRHAFGRALAERKS